MAKSVHDEEKIANLKRINNQLMVDILWEQRASNKIIDEAIIKARRLSDEALDMISKANKKCANMEEWIINECNSASAQVCQEHTHNSRESARLQQKLVTRIDKLHQDQESSIRSYNPSPIRNMIRWETML